MGTNVSQVKITPTTNIFQAMITPTTNVSQSKVTSTNMSQAKITPRPTINMPQASISQCMPTATPNMSARGDCQSPLDLVALVSTSRQFSSRLNIREGCKEEHLH